MYEGGCFCRFVRYRARGRPRGETVCHCTICRRASGAPAMAWFTVAVGDFEWLAGEPRTFQSSGHGRRAFCPRCGTALTFWSRREPELIDVATCSLDEPECVPPRDHTQTTGRLSWVKPGDGLPAFPGPRPPDGDRRA